MTEYNWVKPVLKEDIYPLPEDQERHLYLYGRLKVSERELQTFPIDQLTEYLMVVLEDVCDLIREEGIKQINLLLDKVQKEYPRR